MNRTLKTKLIKYYAAYYHKQLGLPDWRKRIKDRLHEEKSGSYYSATKNIELIESLINFRFCSGKKILVVGAGTGAELAFLSAKQCQVYGIEPDKKALEILHLRGLKVNSAVAEAIPYKDNFFDLVYCWQVLEHVQNVSQSINEMVRVTKPGGYIFIGCPDYRQITEPHYKLLLPLFLPRWLNNLILMLRGRNPQFFNTLQMITAKKIKKILRTLPVTATQIFNQGKIPFVVRLIRDFFEIEPSQYWLIKKF